MRKIITMVVIGMLCCGVAFAAQSRVETVFDNVAIATDNILTSKAFDIKSSRSFGAWIQATTPAPGQGLHTPGVDIIYQMSYDDAADTFASPPTAQMVANGLANTLATVVTIEAEPMRYIRFKAYGAANTTNTTLTMKFFSRE